MSKVTEVNAGSVDVVITTPPCIGCGQTSEMFVPYDGLKAYNRGALAQFAFPLLSFDQRALFMTGTHGPCWDRLFRISGGDDD